MKFTGIVSLCIAATVAPRAAIAQVCGAGGLIATAGSTTVSPITLELSNEYKRKCTGTTFDNKEGGSSTGAKTVCGVAVSGFTNVDVGNMSRDWKTTEATTTDQITYKCVGTTREVVRVAVALDGVSVFVGKGTNAAACIDLLPGKSLSKAQLRWIFASANTDADVPLPGNDENPTSRKWRELNTGCVDAPIDLIIPSATFGTHDFFKEIIFQTSDTFRPFTGLEDNSNALRDAVVLATNAISFMGFSFYDLNDNVLAAIAVEGKLPTATTLTNGDYALLGRSIYSNFWKDTASLAKTKCFADFHFSTVGAAVTNAKNLLPTPVDQWEVNKKAVPGTCAAACPKCGFFRRLFGLCKKC